MQASLHIRRVRPEAQKPAVMSVGYNYEYSSVYLAKDDTADVPAKTMADEARHLQTQHNGEYPKCAKHRKHNIARSTRRAL